MSDLSRLFNAVAKGSAKDTEAAMKDMARKYGPTILGAGLAGPLGMVLATT